MYNRVTNLQVEWSELSRDKNVAFQSFAELNLWFKSHISKEDIDSRNGGYYKTSVIFNAINDEGEPVRLSTRIDTSKSDGDFNPYATNVVAYLSQKYNPENPIEVTSQEVKSSRIQVDLSDYLMNPSLQFGNQDVDRKAALKTLIEAASQRFSALSDYGFKTSQTDNTFSIYWEDLIGDQLATLSFELANYEDGIEPYYVASVSKDLDGGDVYFSGFTPLPVELTADDMMSAFTLFFNNQVAKLVRSAPDSDFNRMEAKVVEIITERINNLLSRQFEVSEDQRRVVSEVETTDSGIEEAIEIALKELDLSMLTPEQAEAIRASSVAMVDNQKIRESFIGTPEILSFNESTLLDSEQTQINELIELVGENALLKSVFVNNDVNYMPASDIAEQMISLAKTNEKGYSSAIQRITNDEGKTQYRVLSFVDNSANMGVIGFMGSEVQDSILAAYKAVALAGMSIKDSEKTSMFNVNAFNQFLEQNNFKLNDLNEKDYALTVKAFIEGGYTGKSPKRDNSISNTDLVRIMNNENLDIAPVIGNVKVSGAVKDDDSLVKAVMNFAGNDDVRAVYNGILIDHNKQRLVGTDGMIIAVVNNVDTTSFDHIAHTENEGQAVMDRNGDAILGHKYPDIDRIVGATYFDIVKVDTKKLLGASRSIIEASKLFEITSGTSPGLGMRIAQFNLAFQATNLEKTAKLFLQMGYDTFNAFYNEGRTSQNIEFRSPDGKVVVVNAPLNANIDSVFAPYNLTTGVFEQNKGVYFSPDSVKTVLENREKTDANLKQKIGFGVDHLTNGEGGIIQSIKTFDELRSRIDAATLQASRVEIESVFESLAVGQSVQTFDTALVEPPQNSELNSLIQNLRTRVTHVPVVYDVEQDMPDRYIVMSATRPLVGTETMQANRLASGASFWSLIDRNDEFALQNLETNIKLDARVEVAVANEDIYNKVALYFQRDNRYFSEYVEALKDETYDQVIVDNLIRLSFQEKNIPYSEMMQAIAWAKEFDLNAQASSKASEEKPYYELMSAQEVVTADGYAKIKDDQAALLYWREQLDSIFLNRSIAVIKYIKNDYGFQFDEVSKKFTKDYFELKTEHTRIKSTEDTHDFIVATSYYGVADNFSLPTRDIAKMINQIHMDKVLTYQRDMVENELILLGWKRKDGLMQKDGMSVEVMTTHFKKDMWDRGSQPQYSAISYKVGDWVIEGDLSKTAAQLANQIHDAVTEQRLSVYLDLPMNQWRPEHMRVVHLDGLYHVQSFNENLNKWISQKEYTYPNSAVEDACEWYLPQGCSHAVPEGFAYNERGVATNLDRQYGAQIFKEYMKDTWAVLPNNSLVEGSEGHASQEAAFKAYDMAINAYKLASNPVMTKQEYQKLHPDYKGELEDGTKMILTNINGKTVSVAVTIKEPEVVQTQTSTVEPLAIAPILPLSYQELSTIDAVVSELSQVDLTGITEAQAVVENHSESQIMAEQAFADNKAELFQSMKSIIISMQQEKADVQVIKNTIMQFKQWHDEMTIDTMPIVQAKIEASVQMLYQLAPNSPQHNAYAKVLNSVESMAAGAKASVEMGN